MGIKTLTSVKKKKEFGFPKLMQSKTNKNLVLLMVNETNGTVLKSGNSFYTVGKCCTINFDSFEDFNSSITLSNE